MEAHAESITIGAGREVRHPGRRVLSWLREAIQQRKGRRAERARTLQINRERINSVQGSEHTHLLNRPRGF